jgi:hypothetical protein
VRVGGDSNWQVSMMILTRDISDRETLIAHTGFNGSRLCRISSLRVLPPPVPQQSTAHASTARIVISPILLECADPYWRRRTSGICRSASPGTDTPCPRVLAPHLGAVFGSPGGFPFFNQPFRGGFVWSFGFLCAIVCGDLSGAGMVCRSNDRLAAVIDVYIPNDHLLADLSPMAVQGLHL